MDTYIPKTNIDDYIDNNELNSRIYEVLLCLNDRKTTCAKHRLERDAFDIFNQAYAICAQLQDEKHPEQLATQLWEHVREKFLLCETNIIFSCVYVILFFSVEKNPNMKFFLTRIRQKLDTGYFQEFEPLIREELTYITAQNTNFESVKKQADEIKDLDERELFYADYITHYKQAHSKGNIIQQIADEVDLIRKTRELSDPADNYTDTASLKLRSVVMLELLNGLHLGTATNDLTKICRLISFITGNSYTQIYNQLQKGVSFSKFHTRHIDEVNRILIELNTSISIDMRKHY